MPYKVNWYQRCCGTCWHEAYRDIRADEKTCGRDRVRVVAPGRRHVHRRPRLKAMGLGRTTGHSSGFAFTEKNKPNDKAFWKKSYFYDLHGVCSNSGFLYFLLFGDLRLQA